MILTALNQYYDRLVAEPDPDTGRLRVPAFGFSEEKVGYVVVISTDGQLVDVINHMDDSGKKRQPKKMPVPRPEKRTSGIQPNFLWDKPAYVLGVQANPDKKSGKETPWIESAKTFDAFKQRHIEILEECDDEGLSALVRFLQKWRFDSIDESPCSHDMLHANLVFQLDGDHCYLHEREAVKKQWVLLLESSTLAAENYCLVTGKREKIARLHPSIKGVFGGQSSGGSIVSFNAESYESYGKSQGENAPVSELAAFKYTTVLNYLLNRENKRCLSVGDASTVFWAVAADGGKTEKAEQLFMQVVNPSDDSEAVKLNPWVEKISQGRPLKEIAPEIDPSTRFYLLGLAPNAARLSIRYWQDTSFGELARHMTEHFTDLSLDPPAWNKPPSIFRLLIELARYRAGHKSNAKDISPHLAGEMMRSILTGDRYPHSLLVQLVLRIRTDGHISSLRIAMIKAVLHRDYRKNPIIKKEVPMSEDEDNKNEAYQLGRLFAVLEQIQSNAIKNANTTITDRYFGSASTTPCFVFPRLLVGATTHHLPKIRKNQNKNIAAEASSLKDDMDKIISKLPPVFSKHLSIEDQGKFCIGYYHKRNNKK